MKLSMLLQALVFPAFMVQPAAAQRIQPALADEPSVTRCYEGMATGAVGFIASARLPEAGEDAKRRFLTRSGAVFSGDPDLPRIRALKEVCTSLVTAARQAAPPAGSAEAPPPTATAIDDCLAATAKGGVDAVSDTLLGSSDPGTRRLFAQRAAGILSRAGGFRRAATAVCSDLAGLAKEVTGTPGQDTLPRVDEGEAKGNLGAIRAGLSIYYGDKEGRYPDAPSSLIPQYIAAIPVLELPGSGHKPSAEVRVINETLSSEEDLLYRLRDSGRWLYVNNPDGPLDGTFIIDCIHKDSKGASWNSY